MIIIIGEDNNYTIIIKVYEDDDYSDYNNDDIGNYEPMALTMVMMIMLVLLMVVLFG